MNVLLIGPGFELPGGIQYVGHLMAEALHQTYGSRLRLDVVSLLDGATSCLRHPVIDWSGCQGSRWQFLKALRNAHRRTHDVVILNHIHLLPYVGVAAAGLSSGPLIVVMHGIEAWRPLSWGRRIGLRRVRRMLYVSDSTRRRATGVNPELAVIDSRVCHHGLLLDEPETAQSPPSGITNADASPPFVLMIGRMSAGEQYKGFEEMIRAWPRIRRDRPELELVIVGGGDDRARLEALAGADGGGIRFAGQVSDGERDRLIQSCAAFALPSRGEGFGLVYLEAMKAAKPVIAGALDAGAEVIVDGVTGRAIDAADEESVVKAVLDVTSSKGKAMGLAGQQRYLEQFTFQSYAVRFGELIEGAVSSCSHDKVSSRGTPI